MEYLELIAHMRWELHKIYTSCITHLTDTNKRLCIKASGVLHGKPIVARQCMTELSKNNEKCLNVSSLLVYDIGKNITNSTVCYCSNDECNSAASLQFTYLSVLSVLTFAIHSMMYQRTKNFIL